MESVLVGGAGSRPAGTRFGVSARVSPVDLAALLLLTLLVLVLFRDEPHATARAGEVRRSLFQSWIPGPTGSRTCRCTPPE